MKVTLIHYDVNALDLLLFTKTTRLQMSPAGMATVAAWSEEEKSEHLRHMRHTIKSSWEFTDYVFVIEGVTRAFTHQLVRHRVGTSFAQQSMRAVDMSDFDVTPGPSINADPYVRTVWEDGMDRLKILYRLLIGYGADVQDARGVLPTNVQTNIVFKANLRTLHHMLSERLCVRAQGEFQDVCLQMREAVVAVHPWTDPMLRVHCALTGCCLFEDLPVAHCAVKPTTLNPATGEAYAGGRVFPFDDIWSIWQQNHTSVQPPVRKVL